MGGSPTAKPRVLVVDDESSILITLPAILDLHGFDVDTAASASEGIQKLLEGIFQIVITDMRMESLTAGYDVVRAAQMQPYPPATLLLTAFPPEEAEWKASGVAALFEKPVNVPALVEELRAIIDRQRIQSVRRTITFPVEPQAIRANKHSQHSRTFDQRREAAFEKSARLKKASQKAISSSREMVQDAKNLIDRFLHLKKKH